MMSQILLQQMDSNGVLTLTLNRPEVHNAFDDALIAALVAALAQATDDPAVRAIVLTGAGSSFSAGADANWMRRMAAASAEENEQDARRLAQLLRRLNYHVKPTVARVNGAAFGGGIGLVSCCDIVIASDQARFALSEVRLGLAPATISPYVFRRIGEGHARRYFLTAARFDADEARSIGLVHQVVPDHQLDSAVQQQVDLLLQGGPLAVKQSKKLVFLAAGHDATQQRQDDEDNARVIARLRVSAEGQEGLAAFLEKRPAAWQAGSDD